MKRRTGCGSKRENFCLVVGVSISHSTVDPFLSIQSQLTNLYYSRAHFKVEKDRHYYNYNRNGVVNFCGPPAWCRRRSEVQKGRRRRRIRRYAQCQHLDIKQHLAALQFGVTLAVLTKFSSAVPSCIFSAEVDRAPACVCSWMVCGRCMWYRTVLYVFRTQTGPCVTGDQIG